MSKKLVITTKNGEKYYKNKYLQVLLLPSLLQRKSNVSQAQAR